MSAAVTTGEHPGSSNLSRIPLRTISDQYVDLRALEYINKVDENLICPICQVALIDPVTTKCDHTFCSACLKQAYETSEICPIDRLPLRFPEDVTRTHKLILNQLDGLQVRCPVRCVATQKSCDLILARSMVQNHVEKYCGLAFVSCSDPSCEGKIWRKDSSKECLHFNTSCPDCGHPYMARDVDWHRKFYCQNRETHCEKCNESIIRCHQHEHEMICPEELDSCQWKFLGCSHHSKRKDLHLHATECDFRIAGPIMRTLRGEIETLQTEVATLSARDKVRERRIKFLETERLNSQPAEIPDISSLSMLESGSPEYAPHDTRDQYLLSLLESQESKVDQISAGMTDLEAKQTMMLFNETIPIKESLAELRSAQGVLGMHVRWLMNFRMQERRPGAGAVGSPSNAAKAGESSSGEAGSVLGMQPTRRLSDSLRENITKL